MARPKKDPVPCSAEGCVKTATARGMCGTHYMREWMANGRQDPKHGEKRTHPLYSIWFERKSRGSLCAAWANDFWAFFAGVGERPSPTHLLRPLRAGLYGPDNFEWLAALSRQPGETRKAFNARKWASRRERFPDFEPQRWLKRRYGITPEDYAHMLAEQNGVCKVCEQPETALDAKTQTPKALAVDHCHDTKRVRGLLCWRCNTTLGKVNDSAPLLRAMATYLEADCTEAPIDR